jgi:hypothetical protein
MSEIADIGTVVGAGVEKRGREFPGRSHGEK